MTDLQATTRGTDIVLDAATVRGFQTSVRGPLFRSGDAGYDATRTVASLFLRLPPAGDGWGTGTILGSIGNADRCSGGNRPRGST